MLERVFDRSRDVVVAVSSDGELRYRNPVARGLASWPPEGFAAAVAQVAIVPVPDDVFGQVGVAVVVPADATRPPSLDALRAFASAEVASYKLPDRVMVVDALPLTTVEKLDRIALERLVQGGAQGF